MIRIIRTRRIILLLILVLIVLLLLLSSMFHYLRAAIFTCGEISVPRGPAPESLRAAASRHGGAGANQPLGKRERCCFSRIRLYFSFISMDGLFSPSHGYFSPAHGFWSAESCDPNWVQCPSLSPGLVMFPSPDWACSLLSIWSYDPSQVYQLGSCQRQKEWIAPLRSEVQRLYTRLSYYAQSPSKSFGILNLSTEIGRTNKRTRGLDRSSLLLWGHEIPPAQRQAHESLDPWIPATRSLTTWSRTCCVPACVCINVYIYIYI